MDLDKEISEAQARIEEFVEQRATHEIKLINFWYYLEVCGLIIIESC
jgi:hypothetical protein